MATLSLRLWAQPHVEAKLGRCVLLDRSSGVVIAVDESGIVAVVLEAEHGRRNKHRARVAARAVADVDAHAHRRRRSCVARSGSSGACAAHAAGRKFVVGAIRAYYEQHVLEPSVKGFLSILEKQFPRADLYLFELLQNAVDDGATRINVELQTAPAPALRLTHDGRGFSPLDVNGLASVGMSSKQSRRAAGFMGIGFKACHKRFAHVRCSDAHWRFEFAERRCSKSRRRTLCRRARGCYCQSGPRAAPPSRRAAASSCCARGGLDAVRRDLRWLPPSVPALLARCALGDGSARDGWELTGGREAGVRNVRAAGGRR